MSRTAPFTDPARAEASRNASRSFSPLFASSSALRVPLRAGFPTSKGIMGFTLVELLVGLVIIAVLTGLLLPGLKRMGAQSRAVKCATQLRQLYTGFVAYAQEHRGYLPRGATGAADDPGLDGWGGIWIRPARKPEFGIATYFEPNGGIPAIGGTMEKLIVCPDARDPKPPPTTYTPYGYAYVCNYEVMTRNGRSERPANLRDPGASETILLIEGAKGSAWGLGCAKERGTWSRVGELHLGGANILWMDGRVTTKPKSALTQADFERKIP